MKFLAQIELWLNDEAQERPRHVDRIKAELASLKTKIGRLNTAFTEGGIELAEFKELKNPLILPRADLKQTLAKTTVAAQLAARPKIQTKFNLVEAAGVEPASLTNLPAATTCLVRKRFSAMRWRPDSSRTA